MEPQVDIDFEKLQADLAGMANEALEPRETVVLQAEPSNLFPLKKNQSINQQIKESIRSRENKKLKKHIKAKHADFVVGLLPKPGFCEHLILRGNFIIGDFIGRVIRRLGRLDRLWISTLSMSKENVETIQRFMPQIDRFDLLISSYFVHTDKGGSIPLMKSAWGGSKKIRVGFCRTHAKIIVMETEHDSFVFETSGNLRSSGCIEHMTIFNSRYVSEFHTSWMEEAFVGLEDLITSPPKPPE